MKEIEVNEYVRLARNQGINKIIDIYDKKYELETDIANEWGGVYLHFRRISIKR